MGGEATQARLLSNWCHGDPSKSTSWQSAPTAHKAPRADRALSGRKVACLDWTAWYKATTEQEARSGPKTSGPSLQPAAQMTHATLKDKPKSLLTPHQSRKAWSAWLQVPQQHCQSLVMILRIQTHSWVELRDWDWLLHNGKGGQVREYWPGACTFEAKLHNRWVLSKDFQIKGWGYNSWHAQDFQIKICIFCRHH